MTVRACVSHSNLCRSCTCVTHNDCTSLPTENLTPAERDTFSCNFHKTTFDIGLFSFFNIHQPALVHTRPIGWKCAHKVSRQSVSPDPGRFSPSIRKPLHRVRANAVITVLTCVHHTQITCHTPKSVLILINHKLSDNDINEHYSFLSPANDLYRKKPVEQGCVYCPPLICAQVLQCLLSYYCVRD